MPEFKCHTCHATVPDGETHCTQCGAPVSTALNESDADRDAHESEPGLFKPGDVIGERYVVKNKIGSGGMGAIYQVDDRVLDEVLALKVLLPYFLKDPVIVARFMNEVRISRKIAHPNIVRVHDFGTTRDGMYISMEYVHGESLQERLDRLEPGEKLTLRFILHIINQLCIALKYAHHFTVHCDIKPANIMITHKKHIKLMDFGISKLKTQDLGNNVQTAVGTPQYMAPEQMANRPDIDARADIYSVGVVFYELLTGKTPTGLATVYDQALNELPASLRPILKQCLAPDRDQRYNDARELRDALRPIIDSLDLASTPGISSSHESSFEPGVNTASSDIFAEAMKTFLEDNRSTDDEATGTSGNKSFQKTRRTGPGKYSAYSSTSTNQVLLSLAKKTAVIVAIVIAASLIYFGADVLRTRGADNDSTDVHITSQNYANRALEILAEDGDTLSALDEAVTALSISDTAENRTVIDTVRAKIIADVKEQAYSTPFDISNLDEASHTIARAAQLDSNPRIRQVAQELSSEVAQLKFTATHINPTVGAVTFRLNNPYYPLETQTVSEGDLLMNRFLVTHIGPRSVTLEDLSDQGKGRRLSARLMERIEAE